MESKERVITQIPLQEIWNEQGGVSKSRLRFLEPDDIIELLRKGSVLFMVADVGQKPRWVRPEEAFEFWKNEAKSHIAETDSFKLEDFPGEYAYVASEWQSGSSPIIVLEKHH